VQRSSTCNAQPSFAKASAGAAPATILPRRSSEGRRRVHRPPTCNAQRLQRLQRSLTHQHTNPHPPVPSLCSLCSLWLPSSASHTVPLFKLAQFAKLAVNSLSPSRTHKLTNSQTYELTNARTHEHMKSHPPPPLPLALPAPHFHVL
jgi:hypothetical protein